MKAFCLKCSKPLGKEVIGKYKELQVVDSKYVFGKEHLEHALSQAEKAFSRGTNVSKEILIEVLVRASAQRQIKKAFEIYGVQESKTIYVLGEELPRALMEEYSCKVHASRIDEGKYEDLKEKFAVAEEEIRAVAGPGFDERFEALRMIIKERISLLETM